MSALPSFPDRMSATLLKQGQVGIGPLLPQDVGAMFTWMNDVEANGLDLPHRPTDGQAFATWLANLAADSARVLFMIRRAGSTDTVGFVILQAIHPVHRSANLGVRIGQEQHRGQGIGKAAIALALDYAWDHLNLMRVQLQVIADNQRAIDAYIACGLAVEGRHVDAAYINGKWHDMLTMAVLRPSGR